MARATARWRQTVWGELVAQVIGAFVGAALVYLVYHDAISSFETAKHISRGTLGGSADSTATFSIFATFPAPYFGSSMIGPLIDQIVGTAFLLMFVFALTDERNQPPKSNPAPFLIGLAVAAIGMSYGANAGYAINPARDFGPRVLAWLGGWGKVALPGVHGYFWVPIVGPFIGGVVGAVVYDLFIRDVLVGRGAPPAEDVEARARPSRTWAATSAGSSPTAAPSRTASGPAARAGPAVAAACAGGAVRLARRLAARPPVPAPDPPRAPLGPARPDHARGGRDGPGPRRGRHRAPRVRPDPSPDGAFTSHGEVVRGRMPGTTSSG